MIEDFLFGLFSGVIISIFLTEIILVVILIYRLVTERKRRIAPSKHENQKEGPSLLTSVFRENFGGERK